MSKFTSGPERSRKRRKVSPTSEVTKEIGKNGDRDSTSVASGLPSIKDLASSESALRRAAMKNILGHLKQRPSTSNLSSTECLQLWRGFFVAIYMHDSKNALSVQNLLREIANTFQIFDDKDEELRQDAAKSDSSLVSEEDGWLVRYHTAFWQTLVKEWAGIDSHRMNKYLLLVRFVTRELATICLRPLFEKSGLEKDTEMSEETRKRKAEPNSDRTREGIAEKAQSVAKILETDGPLNPNDRKIPDGLRLHLLDLYVPEIFTALSTITENISDVSEKSEYTAVKKCMDPLIAPVNKMTRGDSGAMKHIRQKAAEVLKEYVSKGEELQKSFLS